MKIDNFESLAKFIADREQKYSQLETVESRDTSLQSEYDSIGKEQIKNATELII